MPLHFLRWSSAAAGAAAGGACSDAQRSEPVEVARWLADELDALSVAHASAATDSTTVPAECSEPSAPEAAGGSSPSASAGGAPCEASSTKSASATVQRHLQACLLVFAGFTDVAVDRDRATGSAIDGGSGGYSGSTRGSGAQTTRVAAAPASIGVADEEDARKLLAELFALDLPARLVGCLGDLEFEARKDVTGLLSSILRLGSLLGADIQVQEYARTHPQFFGHLVDGYDRGEVATHCGVMLRSCARHVRLVEAFFEFPETALRLLSFTRNENFDISSDAFSSIHDFLLTHRNLSAVFLDANFKEFFALYNVLLQSGSDYVTQRQALKLLSEMLLNRTFMKVMLAYVGEEQFLQIHMNLLREDSKAIQFEAFHVFKIFVANPKKPPRVQQILYKNKEKLMKLLETLRPNRQDDQQQFTEDRNTVIEKLQSLEMPPKGTSNTGGPPTSSGGSSVRAAPP